MKKRYTLHLQGQTITYWQYYRGLHSHEIRLEINTNEKFIRLETWGKGFFALQIGKKCMFLHP